MGYQLGIDIGSANTVIAVSDGDWPQVLTVAGGPSVPSVLYFPPGGGMLFGRAAQRRSLTDPAHGAEGFLRRLGDPTPIVIGGAAYTPEGLLTRFVERVIVAASEARGGPPDHVVVTHPTSWNRHRIELFGEALEQLDGVDVPVTATSAAEALGVVLARRATTRTAGRRADMVAVYDFGAGSFDAAVLSFSDYRVEVVGVPAGVNHAGGADLDALLVEHVLAACGPAGTGLDRSDAAVIAALGRLRAECVAAKETLAADDEVDIPVTLPGFGSWITLTRAELERLVTPTVENTVRAFQRTVRSVPAAPDDLSAVLLYGGGTRMPIVGRMVRAAFTGAGRFELRPAEELALGAALVATGLAEQNEVAPGGATMLIGPSSELPPELASFPGLSSPPFGPVSPAPAGWLDSGPIPVAGLAAAGALAAADDAGAGAGAGPDGNPNATALVPARVPAAPDDADRTVAGGGTALLGGPGSQSMSYGPGGTIGSAAPPATQPTIDVGARSGLRSALVRRGSGPSGGGAGGGGGGSRGPGRGGRGGGGFRSAARSRAGIAVALVAVLLITGGAVLGLTLTGGDHGAPAQLAAPGIPTASSQPAVTPTPVDVHNLVRVSDSAEVAPISETAFANFRQDQKNVTVTFDSGTTDEAFTKLCKGEVGAAGASYELDPTFAPDPSCKDKVVGFEIAHHTLPIVVNPANTWIGCLSLDQLKKIWGAGSTVTKWNDIDSSYPDVPIDFIGPARSSVQTSVFNASISNDSTKARSYSATDLTGVAQSVSNDKNGFGFLDFPTYETYGSRLRGVQVDGGEGCKEPNAITAGNGAYVPLCRPLYLYANIAALKDPATAAYVRYYLTHAQDIAYQAHYVPRTNKTTADNIAKFNELTQGVGPVPA